MSMKYWAAGATAILALSACTPSSETPVTPELETSGTSKAGDAVLDGYMAFANDSYADLSQGEADLSGLLAALPDYARVTWQTKSYDAGSGATVFEGLSVGFGETGAFGLNFETAKLWGFDDSLLIARLNGERLTESGPLLTRMEGTNVTYFGLALALNDMFEATLNQLDSDLPDGFEFGFDKLESQTDRFVLSGVTLRPWELTPLPAEMLTDLDDDIPEAVVDLVHNGQWLIALGRSLSLEKSVSIGAEVAMDMRQPGAEMSALYSVDFAAAENMQGFDIGSNISRGYAATQSSTYTDAMTPGEVITFSGFPAGFAMSQTETYGESSIRDLRLDTLMGFLARSELPGMTERDLLSLGTWRVTDYVSQLNEKDILTADSAYFDGDGFEWIIPSDLRFGFQGAKLNTGELTGFISVFFEMFASNAATDDMSEEEQAQMEMVREGMQKAIALMPEHGLDQIPFDADMSASWNPDTGPTKVSLKLDAEGFGLNALDVEISLPDYDALQAAFESEDREAAFEQAFETAFAFRGVRWFEQDKGGFDKLFGFAHALGKEYPDQGWGAVLGSMEPAQLRSYLGTMTRMGKGAAAEEFPPAVDWIEAYASYLESGGSFEFVSRPPTPITADFIDSFDGEPEPDQVVEIFGLTVTHTK